MKKAFAANLFSLQSMNGVFLDMAFNFCDVFYKCCMCVIQMSIYCQKTHLNVFHMNCF